SSRRRHTRSKRDWSSDVCSSDLVLPVKQPTAKAGKAQENPGEWPLFTRNRFHYKGRRRKVQPKGIFHAQNPVKAVTFSIKHRLRSEERRVGKERRKRKRKIAVTR